MYIFPSRKLAFWKSLCFSWAVLGLCCCRGRSGCKRGAALVVVNGLLSRQLLLLRRTGSRTRGLSSCSSQALEHSLTGWTSLGFVAPRHMGSSWVRDRTCVSCIGQENSLPWSHQGSPWNILWCLVIIHISSSTESWEEVEKDLS